MQSRLTVDLDDQNRLDALVQALALTEESSVIVMLPAGPNTLRNAGPALLIAQRIRQITTAVCLLLRVDRVDLSDELNRELVADTLALNEQLRVIQELSQPGSGLQNERNSVAIPPSSASKIIPSTHEDILRIAKQMEVRVSVVLQKLSNSILEQEDTVLSVSQSNMSGGEVCTHLITPVINEPLARRVEMGTRDALAREVCASPPGIIAVVRHNKNGSWKRFTSESASLAVWGAARAIGGRGIVREMLGNNDPRGSLVRIIKVGLRCAQYLKR